MIIKFFCLRTITHFFIIKSIQIESRHLENTENTKVQPTVKVETTVKVSIHMCSFLINPINIECILFATYYSRREKIGQFTKQMKFLFL